MKQYMITIEERESLKAGIEHAISSNYIERDVVRAVEIAVESTYCAKADCYLRADGVKNIIINSHIGGESTMEDISSIADEIVSVVGRTNDPDYWVEG